MDLRRSALFVALSFLLLHGVQQGAAATSSGDANEQWGYVPVRQQSTYQSALLLMPQQTLSMFYAFFVCTSLTLNFGAEAHVFWWFYKSPQRVSSLVKPWPTILWLQGGPVRFCYILSLLSLFLFEATYTPISLIETASPQDPSLT
jgi:hypothetical protein